jgi:hypothetical protein
MPCRQWSTPGPARRQTPRSSPVCSPKPRMTVRACELQGRFLLRLRWDVVRCAPMPLANSLFCDLAAVELRFHGDLRVRALLGKTSIEGPNSGADQPCCRSRARVTASRTSSALEAPWSATYRCSSARRISTHGGAVRILLKSCIQCPVSSDDPTPRFRN